MRTFCVFCFLVLLPFVCSFPKDRPAVTSDHETQQGPPAIDFSIDLDLDVNPKKTSILDNIYKTFGFKSDGDDCDKSDSSKNLSGIHNGESSSSGEDSIDHLSLSASGTLDYSKRIVHRPSASALHGSVLSNVNGAEKISSPTSSELSIRNPMNFSETEDSVNEKTQSLDTLSAQHHDIKIDDTQKVKSNDGEITIEKNRIGSDGNKIKKFDEKKEVDKTFTTGNEKHDNIEHGDAVQKIKQHSIIEGDGESGRSELKGNELVISTEKDDDFEFSEENVDKHKISEEAKSKISIEKETGYEIRKKQEEENEISKENAKEYDINKEEEYEISKEEPEISEESDDEYENSDYEDHEYLISEEEEPKISEEEDEWYEISEEEEPEISKGNGKEHDDREEQDEEYNNSEYEDYEYEMSEEEEPEISEEIDDEYEYGDYYSEEYNYDEDSKEKGTGKEKNKRLKMSHKKSNEKQKSHSNGIRKISKNGDTGLLGEKTKTTESFVNRKSHHQTHSNNRTKSSKVIVNEENNKQDIIETKHVGNILKNNKELTSQTNTERTGTYHTSVEKGGTEAVETGKLEQYNVENGTEFEQTIVDGTESTVKQNEIMDLKTNEEHDLNEIEKPEAVNEENFSKLSETSLLKIHKEQTIGKDLDQSDLQQSNLEQNFENNASSVRDYSQDKQHTKSFVVDESVKKDVSQTEFNHSGVTDQHLSGQSIAEGSKIIAEDETITNLNKQEISQQQSETNSDDVTNESHKILGETHEIDQNSENKVDSEQNIHSEHSGVDRNEEQQSTYQSNGKYITDEINENKKYNVESGTEIGSDQNNIIRMDETSNSQILSERTEETKDGDHSNASEKEYSNVEQKRFESGGAAIDEKENSTLRVTETEEISTRTEMIEEKEFGDVRDTGEMNLQEIQKSQSTKSDVGNVAGERHKVENEDNQEISGQNIYKYHTTVSEYGHGQSTITGQQDSNSETNNAGRIDESKNYNAENGHGIQGNQNNYGVGEKIGESNAMTHTEIYEDKDGSTVNLKSIESLPLIKEKGSDSFVENNSKDLEDANHQTMTEQNTYKYHTTVSSDHVHGQSKITSHQDDNSDTKNAGGFHESVTYSSENGHGFHAEPSNNGENDRFVESNVMTHTQIYEDKDAGTGNFKSIESLPLIEEKGTDSVAEKRNKEMEEAKHQFYKEINSLFGSNVSPENINNGKVDRTQLQNSKAGTNTENGHTVESSQIIYKTRNTGNGMIQENESVSDGYDDSSTIDRSNAIRKENQRSHIISNTQEQVTESRPIVTTVEITKTEEITAPQKYTSGDATKHSTTTTKNHRQNVVTRTEFTDKHVLPTSSSTKTSTMTITRSKSTEKYSKNISAEEAFQAAIAAKKKKQEMFETCDVKTVESVVSLSNAGSLVICEDVLLTQEGTLMGYLIYASGDDTTHDKETRLKCCQKLVLEMYGKKTSQ